MPDIFISYRSDDSYHSAPLIYEKLAETFGKENVFLDKGTMDAGDDFDEAVWPALQEAKVFIVVIGPDWVGATIPGRPRRIDDPGDYPRREVRIALERKDILLLPIRIKGADHQEMTLPDDIKRLSTLNGLNFGGWYKDDLDILIGKVEKRVPPLASREPGKRNSNDGRAASADEEPADLAGRTAPATTGTVGDAAQAGDTGPAIHPQESLVAWKSDVVGVEHTKLIAQDDKVAGLLNLVTAESAGWAMTVSGEGGIGKTAVTYEAVAAIAKTALFSTIVWVSGKTASFGKNDRGGDAVEVLDWQDVVEKIATQLGCDSGPRKLREREVAKFIRGLDRRKRILLVVDNIENKHDTSRLLHHVKQLGFGNPHKLVAASRWRIDAADLPAPDIPIGPLGRAASIELIKDLGTHNEYLKHAPPGMLDPIYRISEGLPFLIKIIVSRYLQSARSLEEIIDEITTKRQGAQVRQWLYDQSLNELASRTSIELASLLLGTFCTFPKGESVSRQQLQRRSQIENDEDFMHVLEAAIKLSLVRDANGKRQFSIHSLLFEYARREFQFGK